MLLYIVCYVFTLIDKCMYILPNLSFLLKVLSNRRLASSTLWCWNLKHKLAFRLHNVCWNYNISGVLHPPAWRLWWCRQSGAWGHASLPQSAAVLPGQADSGAHRHQVGLLRQAGSCGEFLLLSWFWVGLSWFLSAIWYQSFSIQ